MRSNLCKISKIVSLKLTNSTRDLNSKLLFFLPELNVSGAHDMKAGSTKLLVTLGLLAAEALGI